MTESDIFKLIGCDGTVLRNINYSGCRIEGILYIYIINYILDE